MCVVGMGLGEGWWKGRRMQNSPLCVFYFLFLEKNLDEIFLYTTYAKSMSIFSDIWSELYIQAHTKSQSGH